jgi:hypothetical protein
MIRKMMSRHHEHVAVGEVHHADDPEDHRVADGDQSVDGPERQAVDNLLYEVFHLTDLRGAYLCFVCSPRVLLKPNF